MKLLILMILTVVALVLMAPLDRVLWLIGFPLFLGCLVAWGVRAWGAYGTWRWRRSGEPERWQAMIDRHPE